MFNYGTKDILRELISAFPFVVKGMILHSSLFLGPFFKSTREFLRIEF